ncbi:hypothetical protein F5Y15DRAFT_69631 [Xylariaceae sp. FL0016]|nr:hypothetical protein F5Y15DRAFT_69631 [Xylariaceae sp. FL0016]
MPHYYHDCHHSHHGHHNGYIKNRGTLIIDQGALQQLLHQNALTNSHSGTIEVRTHRPSSSHHYAHHHPSLSTTHYASSSPCRGCLERRELYIGGYCRDCTSVRYSIPMERRRVLYYPERRTIGWR